MSTIGLDMDGVLCVPCYDWSCNRCEIYIYDLLCGVWGVTP